MEPREETIAQALVKRLDRDPRVWEVWLPGETEPQTVDLLPLMGGAVSLFCTCSDQEDPGCGHVKAVEAYLSRKREEAAARQARGLSYTGQRVETGPGLTEGSVLTECEVFFCEGGRSYPLDPAPSQSLHNHSPAGFQWSYGGSGPAQLALAILLDFTGDEHLALSHYQEFKWAHVAPLPEGCEPWEICGRQIEDFLTEHAPGWNTLGPEATPAVVDETPAGGKLADDSLPEPPQMHDEIFHFAGYFGCPSKCRIRWTQRGEKVIVIASQLPEDTGTSVTNRAEHLAEEVSKRYGLDPDRLVWLEHYPDRRSPGQRLPDPIFDEHFSLVSFHREGSQFSRPQWTRIEKRMVETLIGQPLPPE